MDSFHTGLQRFCCIRTPIPFRTPQLPYLYVAYFGAFFAIGSALFIVFAWLRGSSHLLRLIPGAPPVLCDTSAFLLIAAIGLLAATRKNPFVCRFTGISLVVASACYLNATLADAPISIHRYFPMLTARILSPTELRNMHGATASLIVLLLFGSALIFGSEQRVWERARWIIGIIGTQVACVGVLALLAYAANLDDAHWLSTFTFRTPVLSALCMCALGLGLCALCADTREVKPYRVSVRTTSLAIIAALTLFGGINSAIFISANAALAATAEIGETYRKIKAVQGLAEAAHLAESGQRGFLLTNGESYLRLYSLGVVSIHSHLRNPELKDAAGTNFSNLERLISAKLDELEKTIELQSRGKHGQALRIVNMGVGFDLMNQIDSAVATITKALQTTLIDNSARRQQSMRLVKRTVLFSYVVAAILAGLTLLLVWTERRRRSLVEKQLLTAKRILRRAVAKILQTKPASVTAQYGKQRIGDWRRLQRNVD
jgi:CHASE3 domain sensor protein